ncbi:unnamed protein product [Rotaria sp. Silwood2]|nr:unnamed protein product [Rotaria sp. Silwood2]CAF4320249.1 unnamed protein product [Rotaria sp. Silwood2]
MMSFISYVFFCTVLYRIIAFPQINLDLTDWINDNESNMVLQHDCLHVTAWIEEDNDPYQIISYCMSEWPSKWNIQKNTQDPNFTFAELYQLNTTSEQLYLWSAPMDVVERYQLYINLLLTSNLSLSSMATHMFYNCTSPRFGPLCQYSLDAYKSHHLTLNEIIRQYYLHKYEPTTLTCYTHLQCDRGSILACLDWSEICDGIIDCRNGVDEEPCWQIEINECEDNEERCLNWQCIPTTFFHDNPNVFECLDRSDESSSEQRLFININGEPTFAKEDVTCSKRYHHSNLNMKLTSSCVLNRTNLLEQSLFSEKLNTVSNDCWLAVKCQLAFQYILSDLRCSDLFFNETWTEIINKACPDMLYVPAGPVAFGHIYFLYTKENILRSYVRVPPPQYVCYNDQLCGGFHLNRTLLSFNNDTCSRPTDFPLTFNSLGPTRGNWNSMYVLPLYKQLYSCNTVVHSGSVNCNSSIMYRCLNSSKCIVKHRLCDGINDCDYKDDEQCSSINNSCSTYGSKNYFKCTTRDLCIPLTAIEDGRCDCGDNEYGVCDDESLNLHYIRKHISFQTICDGFIELLPVTIDGRNETDETECEYWQCNNTYTRCDGFWNCFNGADEVDCDRSPILKCPLHHHICVSPDTYQFMCLPLTKANDGNIDCLGATDEPQLCRSNNHELSGVNIHCTIGEHGYCTSYIRLCFYRECNYKDYDKICDNTMDNIDYFAICNDKYTGVRSDIANFFCERKIDFSRSSISTYFSLDRINRSIEQTMKQNTTTINSNSSITQQIALQHQQRCHRGLVLRVWLDYEKNLTTETCLCPSSFYGNMCQYQNQRISLTLQFQAYSDSRQTLFAVVVSLIDNSDEGIIHSHQQFSYLYVQDCKTKFNMYLLYLTRPKDQKKHYSIHIDIYEKVSLAYRRSFLIPLKFPFLPVHRVAVQLNIPRTTDDVKSCSNQQCAHGRCIKYSNNPKDISFCQCYRGWSGRYCTISHNCTCSSDSLCIGILANNRSLCVCPMNKWGSQCLFQSTICNSNQNTTCYNGGQCIPTDNHVASNKKFKCICQKGFTGDRCEIADNKIIVSFHQDIILPDSLLIHFIQVIDGASPTNGSTFKMIPIYQNTVMINWSYPFHIAFVQLFNNNYYLITVQKIYHQSTTIIREIQPSDRCPYINEVLNETIVKFHLLRRIKYYHLPCQRYSPQLSCFYDDNHFCLCNNYGEQRLANCFEFNYTKKFDCFGQSACENGAQCLQDTFACPQTSTCVCLTCFYGRLCQFSSNAFGLSLDGILGYHVQPYIIIRHQSRVVKISLVLTIIMTVAGLINNTLLMIAINNNKSRNIGCGIYLISTSIISLFTMIMFALKFSILIIAQMTYIANRLFLQLQCISIDFLLRIGLNMDQWLSACIAVERTVTAIKGASFDKKKSKQMAKYMILILLILNISTTIQDPIHRHLIHDDDNSEKRIWCIVSYSSSLQTFNTAMNIFHFLTPFIINLISSLLIIVMTARQRTAIQTHKSYRKILYKQFAAHNHLIISSIVLVILAIPRLIISLMSSCMKSINDPWLFLIGYFISFMPSMLTFVVFVLPSKSYKEEFWKAYARYKNSIQRRLHLVS